MNVHSNLRIPLAALLLAAARLAAQAAPAAPAAPASAPEPAASQPAEIGIIPEGAMIYDLFDQPDPFYPAPKTCDNPKYRAEHQKECSRKPGELVGCQKYKLQELMLTGVTNTLGVPVAMLSAENKPYFVKIGDECADATVLEIDPKTTCVKWRQNLTEQEQANALRPYKDVYTCLRGLPPTAR